MRVAGGIVLAVGLASIALVRTVALPSPAAALHWSNTPQFDDVYHRRERRA